jgi:PKD repeat protein/sugar lactone lactonase YvrE
MNSKSLIWIMAGILLMAVLVQGVMAAEQYVYVRQWGTPGTGDSQFSSPKGIAVQGTNVYVVDSGNNRIQEFTSAGTYSYQWGSLGITPGTFTAPYGIAASSSGNVFVSEPGIARIQRFNPPGTWLNEWSHTDGYMSYPQGLAVNSTGFVYEAEAHDTEYVHIYQPDGTHIKSWLVGGKSGQSPVEFSSCRGIAINSSGYVYVVSVSNNLIQYYTPYGTKVGDWGNEGTGPGLFDSPEGIAIDANDNVYIADTGNNRIQKFTSTGTYLTQWGSSGTGNSQFTSPVGIAINSDGNVYVADKGNNRIQKFSPSGSVGVISSPFGAAIWIDGVNTGSVTQNGVYTYIDSLTPGTHTVTLKLAGYHEYTFDAIIDSFVDSPYPICFMASLPVTVTSITPITGVNTGSVAITNLAGTNFAPGAGAMFTPVTVNPVHKGSIIDGTGGALLKYPQKAFVSGNYAYVIVIDPSVPANNGLEIVDVTDPANPVHKGSIMNAALMFSPTDIYVSGNYAYVVSQSNTLEIVDVSNPALPSHKGSLNTAFDGSFLNSPSGVYVSGNYAYVANSGANTLEIMDVSNPASPSNKGSLSDGMGGGALLDIPAKVYVSNNLAYVTSQNSNALEIVDVSNPANPVHEGSIINGAGGALLDTPEGVFVAGNYAYVTSLNSDALEIVNVTDPANPSHIGSIINGAGGALLSRPIDVSVAGNYAYIASEFSDALEIVNVTDPANPSHIGSIINGAGGALLNHPMSVSVPYGNYAYLVGWSNALEIVDIGTITGNGVVIPPTQITGTADLTGRAAGSYNVVVVNPDGSFGVLTSGFTVTEPTSTLTVTSIYPNAAENTRLVSITDLSGTNFDLTGATVKLAQVGQSDIPATNIVYISSEKLTCDFDLTGKATGHWDVVVTNPGPGGETATLTNGFTVTAPTPARIASFTYDASNSLTVQFTDTSTGGAHTLLWDFGDGATSTLNPKTYTYSSPGTYQVTLTATYSGPSYSDSEIKQVSVAQITRPVAKDDTHVGVLAHPNEETKSASLNPVPANYEVKMTRSDESFTTSAKPGYVVAKHALRRNGDGPTDLYFVDSDGTMESLGTTHSLPLNVVMEAEDPYSETNGVTSVGTGGGGVGLGALALIPKCSGSCSNNYALLIDGGKSPDDNHIRYWNDISFMYQTLTKVYGYPKGNIKVLMSDGTANSPDDRHITSVGGVPQKDNSPRDLDSDGTDESTLSHIDSATKAHVTGALSDLGSGKATSDNLFIFTTGHGAEDGAFTSGTGHVIYNLWNGDTIKDSEFANALPSSFGTITIVMEQCYGGGFIDDFLPSGYSGTQKRMIQTAASATEPSYGNGFSNVWTRGMAMITDNRAPTNEAEVSPYGNNNGQVAMSEVCSFATAADPAATSSLANHEHPQCSKGPSSLDASTKYLISSGWITSPSVVVSSPNAIETWSRGSARYITWNSKNIANVKIELYNSSSGNYYQLISQTAAGAGKWSWNIPSYTATGTQIYKVRISNVSNSNTNDMSDQYFTIQSASTGDLALSLSPAGASGATIYLDGDSIGAVTSKSSVPGGTHTVTAKKDGYLDQTKGYTQLSTSTPVSFTLDQIGTNERSNLPNSAEDAGRMVITSNIAEAEVWIDEQMAGTTPYERAIIPGTDWTHYPKIYSVTVKRIGYEPVSQPIGVAKGQTTYADFQLKPTFSVGTITQTPSIAIGLTSPPKSIDFSAPITFSSGGPHTATWNWDDGSTSLAIVTEDSGTGMITGSHAYTTTGVNTVTLTVTDSNSGVVQSSTYQYAVVYDPNAGYVVGAGSIDSPAGAYKYDSSSGTALFGFVSKYVKGKSVPQGITEFYYHAGSMNFVSTNYDWLVINSPRATYKGTGQINGQGNYKFTLTAIDGALQGRGKPDKFRIRITDMDEKVRVYDNMLDVDGDTEPTTVVKCGFIIIQK